jgi:hypothetical protein
MDDKDDLKDKFDDIKDSDVERIRAQVKFTLNLKDLRLLLRYFETELLVGIEDAISSSKEGGSEEREYYKSLLLALEKLNGTIYTSVVETERIIIEEFKKREIDLNTILSLMAKDEYDTERIEYIYDAVDELNEEKEEADRIYHSFGPHTRRMLDLIEEEVSNVYMPLVIKFMEMLADSVRSGELKKGEIIFQEGALEDLLNLDYDASQIFLNKLKKIEVKIGNRIGRVVKDYSVGTNGVNKVEFELFISNPEEYAITDREFRIGRLEEVYVEEVED